MPNGYVQGQVSEKSVLVMQKWLKEGQILAKGKSFFAPVTGKSPSNIVVQNGDFVRNGKIINFSGLGNLKEAPYGWENVEGKGEKINIYSDQCELDIQLFPVEMPSDWTIRTHDIRQLRSMNMYRDLLMDKYIRFRDQAVFDTLQQNTTHAFRTNFTKLKTAGGILRFFRDLYKVSITGSGMFVANESTTSAKTTAVRPLTPYMGSHKRDTRNTNEPKYMLLVDDWVASELMASDDFNKMLASADPRGDRNRIFGTSLGQIGNIEIVKTPVFRGGQQDGKILTAGEQLQHKMFADMKKVSHLDVAGLRLYKSKTATNGDANQYVPDVNGWTGQSDGSEVVTNETVSRCMLLGAGATLMAKGLDPKFKPARTVYEGINDALLLQTEVAVTNRMWKSENGAELGLPLAGYTMNSLCVDIAHI